MTRTTGLPIKGLLGLRITAQEGRAQSIAMIPDALINRARKIHLINRALNGADVRAWCDWAEPYYIGRWWLWDGAAFDFITLHFGVKEYLGRAL